MNRNKQVWFTWETQIRNAGLATAFGCELYSFDYAQGSRISRYLRSALSTLTALLRIRPELVFAQCPSLILVGFLAALKPLFGYRFVIDAHNAAFEYDRSGGIAHRLVRFAFRRADWVIVTNDGLAGSVLAMESRPLVLPDKLPVITRQPFPGRLRVAGQRIVTFICSFHTDEPVEEVLHCFDRLGTGYQFFVTGSLKRAKRFLHLERPPAIVFTDFLSRLEYEGLIGNSDLLIDLTTDPDCLVCGAYEALAVGVPIVLSDHPALRKLFHMGCLFSANSAPSLAERIEEYFRDPHTYRHELAQLRANFTDRWEDCFSLATSMLFGPSPPCSQPPAPSP